MMSYETNKSQYVLTHCPVSIPSDHVLLDITYMEGVRFNIKVTYLKKIDVTEDFHFRKVIQNMVKIQYKYDI